MGGEGEREKMGFTQRVSWPSAERYERIFYFNSLFYF